MEMTLYHSYLQQQGVTFCTIATLSLNSHRSVNKFKFNLIKMLNTNQPIPFLALILQTIQETQRTSPKWS
jgi:hypothetical protein